MKLGDVLRKERERRKISSEDAAERLGMSVSDYRELEAGGSPAERWGPILARIAIKLGKPTSRLISKTGKSADAKPAEGQCGMLIREHREAVEIDENAMAELIGISIEEMRTIETGRSPVETYGPMLLAFAEMIDQPIFNLFYPCGLPFEEVDNYP